MRHGFGLDRQYFAAHCSATRQISLERDLRAPDLVSVDQQYIQNDKSWEFRRRSASTII
jgi:hypothetical protein